MKKIRPKKFRDGSLNLLGNKNYIFEPKLDGLRAIYYLGEDFKFVSIDNIDLTGFFPELNVRSDIKAEECILDGEIVAFDNQGNPSYDLLQEGQLTSFVAFDILYKDGSDLTKLPLIKRKKILDQTIIDGNFIAKIPFLTDGKKLWNSVLQKKLEGLVAKKQDSNYKNEKQNETWFKIKPFKTIDCVIVGYSIKDNLISTLYVGNYNHQKNLVLIGKVDKGFSQSNLTLLSDVLPKIELPKSIIKSKTNLKDVNWVKPKIVCEIQYDCLTKNNLLKNTVFRKIRHDKKPIKCIISEQI